MKSRTRDPHVDAMSKQVTSVATAMGVAGETDFGDWMLEKHDAAAAWPDARHAPTHHHPSPTTHAEQYEAASDSDSQPLADYALQAPNFQDPATSVLLHGSAGLSVNNIHARDPITSPALKPSPEQTVLTASVNRSNWLWCSGLDSVPGVEPDDWPLLLPSSSESPIHAPNVGQDRHGAIQSMGKLQSTNWSRWSALSQFQDTLGRPSHSIPGGCRDQSNWQPPPEPSLAINIAPPLLSDSGSLVPAPSPGCSEMTHRLRSRLHAQLSDDQMECVALLIVCQLCSQQHTRQDAYRIASLITGLSQRSIQSHHRFLHRPDGSSAIQPPPTPLIAMGNAVSADLRKMGRRAWLLDQYPELREKAQRWMQIQKDNRSPDREGRYFKITEFQ